MQIVDKCRKILLKVQNEIILQEKFEMTTEFRCKLIIEGIFISTFHIEFRFYRNNGTVSDSCYQWH